MRWVELFLALRLLKPTRSYVSAITVLSLLGVIAGVMVLIVVLSVMSGFEKELREKVIGFHAHVTLGNRGILRDYESMMDDLGSDKRVIGKSAFVMGPVLAQIHGRVSTPYIRGIDQKANESVTPLLPYLVEGEWLESDEGILVGVEWAKRNDAQLGDRVVVHSPSSVEKLIQSKQGEPLTSIALPSEYIITGIFNTGMYEYDYNFFILTLGEAQRIYQVRQGVHGIALRLKDANDVAKWSMEFNQKHEDSAFHAMTWMDQNRQLFEAIAVERRVMAFLLFFVMLVAAFGISSTLLTITTQRAKQIGVLKAMGATQGQILRIFTLYGLVIGVVGSGLGVVLGLSVVRYRNELSDWLATVWNMEIFPASVYHFAQIPSVVDIPSVFIIASVAVLTSTLAASLPAYLASRYDPVETLRAE